MNFMIPFGNLYFKFGREAGAIAFLGLYISDLDNSAPDWVRRCYFGLCGKMSSSASFLLTVNANRQTESFFIWKKGPKVAHIYFLKGFSNCFYPCKKVFFKPYMYTVCKEKLFDLAPYGFLLLVFCRIFRFLKFEKFSWPVGNLNEFFWIRSTRNIYFPFFKGIFDDGLVSMKTYLPHLSWWF
jgi:hypothetical protein